MAGRISVAAAFTLANFSAKGTCCAKTDRIFMASMIGAWNCTVISSTFALSTWDFASVKTSTRSSTKKDLCILITCATFVSLNSTNPKV
eukprot:Skav201156  [mRNA]  locus=scaffold1232:125894:128765:+ [translate_table: standard]